MMQIAQRKTQSASRAARLRFALQVAEQATKVGDRIAQERTARSWSRPDLARRLPGVTSGNDVYRWEKGKHVPRSDMLEAIADLFEITVADLYAGPVADREELATTSPDLMDSFTEAEEATRLDRIERKLDLLLESSGLAKGQGEDDDASGEPGGWKPNAGPRTDQDDGEAQSESA